MIYTGNSSEYILLFFGLMLVSLGVAKLMDVRKQKEINDLREEKKYLEVFMLEGIENEEIEKRYMEVKKKLYLLDEDFND
jgi:hypothetical protein